MSEPKLIPQTFQAQSNVLSNYDYTDIAEGTGMVIFYGSNIKNNTTEDHILSNQTLYSYSQSTSAAQGNNGDYTKVLDVDFDLSAFNRPKTIKGTAIFHVSEALYYATANCYSYLIIKVRKYSGSTETEIANVTTPRLDTDGAGTFSITHKCTLTIPQTHFKRGDILRITIEGYCKGGSGTIMIAHDPQGAAITSWDDIDTSQLIAYIPFRIDEVGI